MGAAFLIDKRENRHLNRQHVQESLPTEASPQITFSAEDVVGVHMPHNDSLLVEVEIGDCTVTKVLVDTGSSVNLIFKNTLIKLGINLDDMKPSVRSLTCFNGSSKTMLGTIRLHVYAHSVLKNVKFSVIDVRAPHNAILGTPWIHAMKAIPSTYHQCVKFPENDSRIVTLCGDQAAACDLLVAEFKNQQAVAHVNTVAKPIQKIYPLQEEILEVTIDDKVPAKTVRIRAYLSDETKDKIVSFLKRNVSTFAWSTTDMK
ncbi:hypothetical protein N665_1738s0001 [Sinapis alba]|nr:hypothetical protein N665_1738s0001 [Sinapis alba]